MQDRAQPGASRRRPPVSTAGAFSARRMQILRYNSIMRRLLPAFAFACSLALGCSRPDPPTLTPEQATVTHISPDGLDVDVKLEAYNPNSIDLSARSVKAKVTLDGKYHVGDVKTAAGVKLPAHKRTQLA